MMAGENPYEAAVAGALLNGRTAQAQTFADQVRPIVPAAVAGAIDRALAAARTGAGAQQAGTDLSSVNAISAAPAAIAATSPPPQATHGETAAVGYFNWLLHNSHNVALYYGACNTTCHTDGYWDADLNASVFYASSEGLHWYNYVTYGGGISATLQKWQVRLFRDISGGTPDTDEHTLPCSHTSISAECNNNLGTGQGYVQGHWYYIRVDYTEQPNNGDPSGSLQIQTRRYQVVNQSSYDWEFQSYRYFGN
jgi:hypothetical protein